MEMVSVTRQKQDPAWKHGEMLRNGGKVEIKGGGIHRFKEHLACQKGNGGTCSSVHPDVRLQMIEILSRTKKRPRLAKDKPACDSPGNSREDGMSWDREDGMSGKTNIKKKRETVVTKALDVVNSNTAVFPALNLKKKVSIVDMAVGLHEVRYDVDQFTAALGKNGWSILVYDSSSEKCKTCVNLFASSPEGTIFLRSADISCAIDSADALYELLKETVEEIGQRNVVQVVTTGEERNAIAGRRLAKTYPSIFWTPCAGYCIDLMLQDIGELPMVKMILDQAKSMSRYIYSNATTINMIRRYTSGVDLVDLGTTRSSSDFMTLKRMVNVRPNLQSMVTSEEWMESSYSKKEEGYALLDSICDQSFWSTCASITRLIDPMLHLLRIVSSQKMPSMGSIYAGLYRVKDAIKKELVTREQYLVYWSIIDHRWEQLQRHPLHAASFYLNPRHFYSLERDGYLHIQSLVYDCIEKLVPEPNIQDKIMRETTSYHSATGDFGRKLAIRARDTILPKDSEKNGWMDVEPPYGNVMASGPQINDVEAHGAGFDDYEILFGVKDSEEETGCENIHIGNTGDKTIVPEVVCIAWKVGSWQRPVHCDAVDADTQCTVDADIEVHDRNHGRIAYE
ncbi:hypothetical protein SASPL_103398 [Salvia splendens]|uniref:DUF659 domain-containing protein n=1 Tax=Salvia splendens TaxID=180675 RepID=A0A8X8YY90_SALSN|nr:hypothetical protein SASPL_103398 [Salvia splendens]